MSDSNGEHISPHQSSFVNRVAAVMLLKKQTAKIPENKGTLPRGYLEVFKREGNTRSGEMLKTTHI